MLTPQEYDKSEKEARKTTCNRIIEASACEVFNMRGYPTRVESPEELWRYADCMQENRTEKIFNNFLLGLSEDEFEKLKLITEKVYKHIGKVPTASVLWSILAWRNIKPFLQKGDTVFELGGGSGYLGVFLSLDGYKYISTDVCQGFYIWQDNLMEIFEQEFVHLPYWEYMKIADLDYKVDCVIANDVVTEMSWEAFQYLLRQSQNMLQRGNRKMFYVQGVGLQHKYTFKSLLSHFDRRGIMVDYADKHNMPEDYEKDPVFYWMTLKGNYLNAKWKVKELRDSNYPVTLEAILSFYRSLNWTPNDDEKFYNYCNL